MTLTCFKTYDIRGRLGVDLDEGIARRVGRGFARALGARRVVLGRDIRASSEVLAGAVTQALVDEGCEVLDLGLSGTEEMYLATTQFDADGGICVTASHNPMDYNGMKMVRGGSAPLDAATGLARVKALAEVDAFGPARPGGNRRDIAAEARAAYVARVLSFVDVAALKPLTLVVNAGNRQANSVQNQAFTNFHRAGGGAEDRLTVMLGLELQADDVADVGAAVVDRLV